MVRAGVLMTVLMVIMMVEVTFNVTRVCLTLNFY